MHTEAVRCLSKFRIARKIFSRWEMMRIVVPPLELGPCGRYKILQAIIQFLKWSVRFQEETFAYRQLRLEEELCLGSPLSPLLVIEY